MGRKDKEKVIEEKVKKEKKHREKKPKEDIRYKYLRWYKLDNSAHLFPVISGEMMTNTYRISAILTEDVVPELLQEALDELLPKFEPFNVRLRSGLFWHYFEENGRKAPIVREETLYPCAYIHPKLNHEYLFRVSYYKKRINLEVFHALADGMGGINFLRELVYHYLRKLHPKIVEVTGEGLTSGTTMNPEDSFLRYYKRPSKPLYAHEKAYHIKGEKLRDREFGLMSFMMDLDKLKEASHKYGASINEYLVAAYTYAIYDACMHGLASNKAIRVAVPVNLRSIFDSITSRNFFVMISSEFKAEHEDCTFEEVLKAVKESLNSQMGKEHLENIFSYNVSNQANLFLRLFPLFLKNVAMRFVYNRSARANTSTMTNIGNIKVAEPYGEWIENFSAVLCASKGQHIKATICSYANTMTVTFGSFLHDTMIQECFVKQLVKDENKVSLETNGVYYG